MSNPLISIIICCYNRAHMLTETLESVFAQQYQPIEILIVDDGSTDGTPELIKSYGDKIRYYWHENQGVAKTRTKACQLARGEYIAFIDDDDLMPPDRITSLYDATLEFPQAIFITGDFEIINDQGNLTGKRWLPVKNDSNKQPCLLENGHEAVLWPHVAATVHTTLFRKSYGEKIGWFDEKYQFAGEDKDFFARLGELGPIVHIPKVVSFYRRGHNSLTTVNLNGEYEKLLLFNTHIKKVPKENQPLIAQLQSRILSTLTRISSNKNKESSFSKQEMRARIKSSKALLSPYNKLRYFWNILGKNQVKKLLKRK